MKKGRIISTLLFGLWIALLSGTAFSAISSYFQQANDWAACILNNSYVKLATQNQDQLLSINFYKGRTIMSISRFIQKGVYISDVNLYCNITIDNTQKYYVQVIGSMQDDRVEFYFFGIDGGKLYEDMIRGNTIIFSLYGKNFDAYDISFSLNGFTAMVNYAVVLCKQVLGY